MTGNESLNSETVAWGALLEAAMDERLSDGTPVLSVVFAQNPGLAARLREVLTLRPVRPVGCGVCLACDPPNAGGWGNFGSRMYLCATCGNKRCPASGDCLVWECSGSNDPDQIRVERPRIFHVKYAGMTSADVEAVNRAAAESAARAALATSPPQITRKPLNADEVPDHACDTGHFDRSICPHPCGSMHSYCTTCGALQDSCPHEEVMGR